MSESPPQARPPRRRRLGRILFVGTALLIAVALLGIHTYNVTGLNRYEAAKQRARAGGHPLNFEEIEAARPVWPEEDNGARVVEALIPQLDKLRADDEFYKLPVFSPDQNPPFGRLWSPRQQETIRAQLRKGAQVLAQLDQLTDYVGGRFKSDVDTSSSLPDPIGRHWTVLRFLARLKALQMLDRAMRTGLEPLATDLTVLALLPRLLEGEPMSAFLATALDELTVDALERACSLRSFDTATLQKIDSVLAGMESPDRLYWHVLGERAWSVTMYDRVAAEAQLSKPKLSVDGFRDLLANLTDKGTLGRTEANRLRLTEPFLLAAHDRRQFLQVFQDLPYELDKLPRSCAVLSNQLPVLGIILEHDTPAIRRIRFARTALAAERYRIDHGSLPMSLDDLVPDYLAEPLTDPFDGNPLGYRIQEGVVIIDTTSPESFAEHDETSVGSQGHERAKPPCFRLLPPEERGLPPEECAPASQPASAPEVGGSRTRNLDDW